MNDSPHILHDPDSKLHEARKQWRIYADAIAGTDEERCAAQECASAYDDLDMHLSAGGDLPADWDVAPPVPKPISWSIREIESALTTNQRTAVIEQLEIGRKIVAIKELRTFLGCGLKESKDYVDWLDYQRDR